MTATLHASAVSLGGRGVLIRGASGSGKSSLVLALIDRDPQATLLVADDRVAVAAVDGRLMASAPAAIAGKLEVRGQGILDYSCRSPAAIDLVVDLLPPAECPRLPEESATRTMIAGIALPRLMLPIGIHDGALRVRAAIHRLGLAAAASAKPLALQNRLVKSAPLRGRGPAGRKAAASRQREIGEGPGKRT